MQIADGRVGADEIEKSLQIHIDHRNIIIVQALSLGLRKGF